MSMTNAVLKSAWRSPTTLGFLVAMLILTCLMSPAAFAQPSGAADAYYIGYFGNANLPGFPDTQVNIVNPGSTGGYSTTDLLTPVGDLCANIYVFTADQQMRECCSCFTTPNGHIQLSTNKDLTANPLQNIGVVPPPVAGVIKIVSSSPAAAGSCLKSKAPVAATTYAPNGSLRTWNTHARGTVTGSSPLYTVTETAFRPATLSDDGTELAKIQAQCYFLWNTGSGTGICTCGKTPI